MSRETTRYFIFLVLLVGEARYKALFLVLLVGESGMILVLEVQVVLGVALRPPTLSILGEQTLFFVSQAVLQRG